MPLFYTPKPRQFRYQPRFYDPQKEKWEALKQKYADERLRQQLLDEAAHADTAETVAVSEEDMAYFERRVREIDRKESNRGKLTWKDLFRKREMPEFHYQPRFADDGTPLAAKGTGEHIHEFKRRNVKMKRRFDIADDNYMKPVPASRIMLYTLLVCLLLYWILF
jgi:hypothetical protein